MIEIKMFSYVRAQDGICKFFSGGKNLRGYPIKIFVKKVAMGNAVQILFNFPAKSLSI